MAYDSAELVVNNALKTNFLSVRLIKNSATINPKQESYMTNILLNGKCIDPETRCLYVFYIDTYFNSAWIIEFNIDTRVQTVVYYDKYNVIGFDPLYKIFNARVVHGKLVWTDNKNPIYQMDIARAKKSFYYKIGYGGYPNTAEWDSTIYYGVDQIVSNGNYFYKSTIDGNVGVEPKSDDGTLWTKLCLIEDAYYSMNVENFYLEPMPPKLPPVLEYISDDTRKINSLKQTLFQVAYRYVYMDWRKSTFSPASIVPLPQGEEEPTTGLATEIISLNNGLKITVNTGGEEVRAIEIIGRSSNDPSKWYLIETINKFDEEERGGEVSLISDAAKTTLTLTVKTPIVTNGGITLCSSDIPLGLAILDPTVLLIYFETSQNDLSWYYDEYDLSYPPSDPSIIRQATITVHGVANGFIDSIPSWIYVWDNATGTLLTNGDTITNGQVLDIFPNSQNDYDSRTDYFRIIDNASGTNLHIVVTQAMSPAGCSASISVNPDMQWYSALTLENPIATVVPGSHNIDIEFTPHHDYYGSGTPMTFHYDVLVGGTVIDSGTFDVLNDNYTEYSVPLTMQTYSGEVFTILVYEGYLT